MVHGNTKKWMEWYFLIDLIDKYRILIMLFKPNLKQCKLEQINILNFWKNDNKMRDALDNIIDVFLIKSLFWSVPKIKAWALIWLSL